MRRLRFMCFNIWYCIVCSILLYCLVCMCSCCLLRCNKL